MMRYEGMSPFLVMDVVREAARYEDAIHFEIGQPDLPPAPGVRQAFADALAENRFRYTESMGLPPLREAICAHYQRQYGVHISPDRVVLTPGSSGAFLIAYALTLAAGDGLGLTDPCYPCYQNFAHFMHAVPHFFAVDYCEQYQLHPAQLQGSGIRALQISSPANPTGNVYTPERLAALVKQCAAQRIDFISDELYHGLCYDQPAATALQYSDDVYVINGFSKYFCMPGARLGWLIVPKNQVRAAEILVQNLFICAPTLSQYAAIQAFDTDYLHTVEQQFAQRRDYLYHALQDVFTLEFKPQGAFYLWADVSRYSRDGLAFVRQMLADIHVAATPGVDFGRHGTEHYVRFAYTRDMAHMAEGVARMKDWLSGFAP